MLHSRLREELTLVERDVHHAFQTVDVLSEPLYVGGQGGDLLAEVRARHLETHVLTEPLVDHQAHGPHHDPRPQGRHHRHLLSCSESLTHAVITFLF